MLSKIRGEDLGRALLMLPLVSTHEGETADAVIEAVGVGRVRVTFKKFVYRHGRSRPVLAR